MSVSIEMMTNVAMEEKSIRMVATTLVFSRIMKEMEMANFTRRMGLWIRMECGRMTNLLSECFEKECCTKIQTFDGSIFTYI